MSNHARLLGAVLALFLTVPAAPPARADGCYFKDRAVQKRPTIPTQRALLVWDKGRETLVIESALDAEGQRFGWVIPLPSVPEDVAQAHPSLFLSLHATLQPYVVHGRSGLFRLILLLSVGLGLWLIYAMSRRCRCRTWKTLLYFLLLLVLAMLFTPALLGSRGKALSTVGAGIEVVQSLVVGNYDAVVLKAQQPQALARWLAENDFSPLPPAGEAIVAHYVQAGWCFVATRLRRNESGRSTPHPIAFTFASETPVYPLRLTRLAADELPLELYVYARRAAAHPFLEQIYCDRFVPWARGRHQPAAPGERPTALHSQPGGLGNLIEHPAVVQRLPFGGWMTRLAGTLSAAQMDSDMVLRWTDGQPHRQVLYSWRGALYAAATAGLLVWVVLLACGTILGRSRIEEPDGWRWARRRLVLPVSLGAVALTLGILLFLPKTAVTMERRSRFAAHAFEYMQHELLIEVARHAQAGENDPERLAALCLEQLREVFEENPFTGEALAIGTGPGEFTVAREAGALWLTCYDRWAYPRRYAVPAPHTGMDKNTDTEANAPGGPDDAAE